MLTTAQLIARYGNPAAGEVAKGAFARKWIVLYTFPSWLVAHFPPAPGVATRITRAWVNRDVVKPFEAVMRELVETGLIQELKTYDGCWVVRNMRGLSTPSRHSWGIAFDFNARQNPLGGRVTFSAAFLAVWRKHGFACGADWKMPRTDGMHFELAVFPS